MSRPIFATSLVALTVLSQGYGQTSSCDTPTGCTITNINNTSVTIYTTVNTVSIASNASIKTLAMLNPNRSSTDNKTNHLTLFNNKGSVDKVELKSGTLHTLINEGTIGANYTPWVGLEVSIQWQKTLNSTVGRILSIDNKGTILGKNNGIKLGGGGEVFCHHKYPRKY